MKVYLECDGWYKLQCVPYVAMVRGCVRIDQPLPVLVSAEPSYSKNYQIEEYIFVRTGETKDDIPVFSLS